MIPRNGQAQPARYLNPLVFLSALIITNCMSGGEFLLTIIFLALFFLCWGKLYRLLVDSGGYSEVGFGYSGSRMG